MRAGDKPVGFRCVYWRWEHPLMLQTLASSPGVVVLQGLEHKKDELRLYVRT